MTEGWPSYDTSATPEGEDALRSLTVAYIKQNAGEDLTWRPTKDWHFGAGYGYERYDYTRADAASTDEHTAKLFADWKPASWFTLRTSGSYSDRTANDYDYMMKRAAFPVPRMQEAMPPPTGSSSSTTAPAPRRILRSISCWFAA